jgi:chromosome segregation ATPase
MVHRNQEIIAKLKAPIANTHQFAYYTDDLVLMEKKAEFEALDLAINNRKQQLVNMEFARNRRLHESYSSDGESFLKDEIFYLEETLHRRNKELNKVESELKAVRREMSHFKDAKVKIERDLEILMKKNTMVNKEMFIFDRKAEEATVDLLLAQEQLESVKEQKKMIEANIDALRFDLFGYLKVFIFIFSLNIKSSDKLYENLH